MFEQTDEELDPEDVELDEQYTVETRSKCKPCTVLMLLLSARTFVFQSSDELDTDTEFEPGEDNVTIDKTSKCKPYLSFNYE